MKPYDPKLNPGKTIEETIENFIEWIRMSNRNTSSVLRSVNEKLDDLSKTEENLKALENAQVARLEKIDQLMVTVTQLPQDKLENESSDSLGDLHEAISSLTNEVRNISKSISKYQEYFESQLTHGMNTLEGTILNLQTAIQEINSELRIPNKEIEAPVISERTIQQELSKIRSQIICPSEDDKSKILTIINTLIDDLSGDIVEITGLNLKKRLIDARTQVYEQTEGLAPRFRIMIDNFMGVIRDGTIYSRSALDHLLIEGLKNIYEIYQSAPVGQF